MRALLIHHKSDFDGVFSCLMIQSYLDHLGVESRYFAWTYGEDIPQLNKIINNYYDNIFLLDLSFSPEIMLQLKKSGKLTWIDHHQTAIELSEQFGYDDLPGIRSTEFAACELSYAFVIGQNNYRDESVPKIIKLLSAYDIFNFARVNWEGEALPLQYGLRSVYGLSAKDIYPDLSKLLIDEKGCLTKIINRGKIIYDYQKRLWENAVKNYSFEVKVANKYKGICLMTTLFESTQFISVINNYDFQLVVNRRSNGNYSLSLYKQPGVLPEFHNGKYLQGLFKIAGGHPNAAGCTLNEEEFIKFLTTREI